MINAAITALNELSSLLNEIEVLLGELQPAEAPAELLEIDHERILDEIYLSYQTFDVPRNMNIISMLPIKPDLATTSANSLNVGFCPKADSLDITIRYY